MQRWIEEDGEGISSLVRLSGKRACLSKTVERNLILNVDPRRCRDSSLWSLMRAGSMLYFLLTAEVLAIASVLTTCIGPDADEVASNARLLRYLLTRASSRRLEAGSTFNPAGGVAGAGNPSFFFFSSWPSCTVTAASSTSVIGGVKPRSITGRPSTADLAANEGGSSSSCGPSLPQGTA